MEVIYSQKARRDIEFWKKSGNKMIMKKITALLIDINLHPYEGLGKPEALKYNLSGVWFRRITQKHRLIYQITDENKIEILNIMSLKGHYE